MTSTRLGPKPAGSDRRTAGMNHFARLNLSRFQILMIVAIVLTVVLAACNNGTRAGY